jgi:molybdopterin synthase sulfur carrier subunit
MQIRALFFASYRELLGIREMSVSLPGGSDVASLVQQLLRQDDVLRALPPNPVVAVNEEYADAGTPLKDGDVVAFIPPVAGG